ncbi:hypothetical protein CWE15_07255 [Aliidiomarina taiwanensis]|uniref:Uncharacterized protein n=1 Tax=Aliidiomarina taiwanensis TaxID=946228 RepID=A0A432X1Y9_9GAMM|nr:hypothetical protein [Aliidiomarina taiwanensis]RUO40542.1 hypothetical protein CWE15_07255 [Aliidiomarina taiwanensis]
MIETAVRGPYWRGASQVLNERKGLQQELQRQNAQRKAPEQERTRVADYLRTHKDLNRAAVRYPFDNLKSTVDITRPPSVINIYV